MPDRVEISFQSVRSRLTLKRDRFSTFARSYLTPLLADENAELDIEVMLEWDTELPLEDQSDLEQLGRRIWVGEDRLRFSQVWQVPGLQVDVNWQEPTLGVRATYSWPTRRAKWWSRTLASLRERLFVSLLYYLIYFPSAWWLERERGWTLHHAAAISTPEGGLVFSGLPGSGKSTATLAALCAMDWQIVSDNLLFTDGSQVYACPEPIHVDGRTLALLSDMPAGPDETLAGRVRPTGRRFSHQRQDYEITSAGRRASTTPLALGFLNVGRQTAVQPIDRTTAARRLMANDCLAKEWTAYQESAAAMHQVWPTVGNYERRWGNLTTLVDSVPCYDVTITQDGALQQDMEHIIEAMLDGRG